MDRKSGTIANAVTRRWATLARKHSSANINKYRPKRWPHRLLPFRNGHVTLQKCPIPQPRQYATRAQQQSAYHHRRIALEKELLSQKGLPALPATPTMPGNARWSTMIAQVHLLLSEAVVEMQNSHDGRSPAL